MTFTKLVVALALAATATTAALAEEKKLTGAEIKAAYSGTKTTSTTPRGTFLIVWKADGTMAGTDKLGNYPDKGKWWVKGDRFCRKWNWWIGGKEECFGVALDGQKVTWWRADGSQMHPDWRTIFTK